MKGERPMRRLRDILTKEEDTRVQALKMELLDAHNKKERELIMAEINEIFQTAKERYKAINASEEQAFTREKSNVFANIAPKVRFRVKKELAR
jgi:hypothetical protein